MILQRMYKFSSPVTTSGAPSYLTIWMDMTSLPNSLHELWLVFTEKQLCEEKNNIGRATTHSTVFVVIFFVFSSADTDTSHIPTVGRNVCTGTLITVG